MIIEYIGAVVTGMILDSIWLGWISKPLYQKYIGSLMLKNPRLLPAALFYFIFAAAVLVFVVTPAIAHNWGVWRIIGHGALLGLVIYGGYDLTNLAVLQGWPVFISVVDIIWGVLFSTIVSLVTVYIGRL